MITLCSVASINKNYYSPVLSFTKILSAEISEEKITRNVTQRYGASK